MGSTDRLLSVSRGEPEDERKQKSSMNASWSGDVVRAGLNVSLAQFQFDFELNQLRASDS